MIGAVLGPIDLAIIVGYLVLTVVLGFWVSRRAAKDTRSYFLGGNNLPWYALGLSNASGQFDIGGTMWMVYLLFVYGLKSAFIPWLWPVFNQIFLMVFLSAWLRRSGVMTGAEWITFRFGEGRGAVLSHLIIVFFALMVVLGYLAFSFVGIGKFAAAFFPYSFSADPGTNEQIYGLLIVLLTAIYVVKGGMYSVVVTELLQFAFMFVASIAIGVVAMNALAPGQIEQLVPTGWSSLAPKWELGLDWSGRLEEANNRIAADGWNFFSLFLGLVFFQGVLKSLAGPAPNYDMQRILSARTPKEAAWMSGIVNIVLLWPRYMMIAGLTVLALLFQMDDLRAAGAGLDFEQILPYSIAKLLPVGLAGMVVAGLIAAFMSSFAAVTNAAPAYVVNDLVKRYWKKDAPAAFYVRLSIAVSALFVVIGTALGLLIPSLNAIIMWITAALYGGYAAANTLKWYWWRFNGFGYFWGMVAGIASAMPFLFVDISAVFAFPIVLLVCLVGSIAGTLLTEPDDMEVLKRFYVRTRPWGFWGPVLRAAQQDDASIRVNPDMKRDLFSVGVGIIWQTALTVAPIFLVIKQYDRMAMALAVVAVTTLVLKLSWFDRLKNEASDYDNTMVGGR